MADVFSPLCIRLTTAERARMKTLLDEYDIDHKNVHGGQHKLSTKKNIIDMAREFSVYFARLYPVNVKAGEAAKYLAVAHSGVRLVRRQKSLPTDYLEVSKNDVFDVSLYVFAESKPSPSLRDDGRICTLLPALNCQLPELLDAFI